jgi:hypothetical protein
VVLAAPTLSRWTLGALALVLLAGAAVALRRPA